MKTNAHGELDAGLLLGENFTQSSLDSCRLLQVWHRLVSTLGPNKGAWTK